MKLKHGHCRQLVRTHARAAGRLSSSTSCSARYAVVAKGTTSWSVTLTSPLSAGTYTIYARLTDTTKHATTAHRAVVLR